LLKAHSTQIQAIKSLFWPLRWYLDAKK
jgi:hypothetical protein